jgi:acetyl esterase/lipase
LIVARIAQLASLLLVTSALLLGLTIPFTMPTNGLQLARLVVSELSPYLGGVAAIATLLSLRSLLRAGGLARRRDVLGLAATLIAVGTAALPLSQLPDTITQSEEALRDAVGRVAAPNTAPTAGEINIVRDVPFRTISNLTLRLDRYDPPFSGPHPAVVVIHGGAWSGGDKGDFSLAANRYLAARGYVVYDIQYRLAPAFRFPAALEDVECALGYVRAHPNNAVDPERVALIGRSAGAHLALLAAYRAARDPVPTGCDRPAAVQGVIALYPPTDLVVAYREPAIPDLIDARGTLEAFLGGSPESAANQYRDATPQSWLDRPVPPTMLIHGLADQIVRPNQSVRLADALRAAGQRVGVLLVPWAGHGFDAIPFGFREGLISASGERFLASLLH